MRIFANIFLMLFLIDGVVSFIDELFLIWFDTHLLSALRNIFAWMVILVSIPFYISLGIDKRLPKLLFLPQLFFVFWALFQLWPVPVTFENSDYSLIAAIGQVLLGAIPLLYLRFSSNNHFLTTREMFSGPFFGLKNTLIFLVANVVIMPLAIIFMVLSVASNYLYEETAGFSLIKLDGIYMKEKIYRLEDKEIRLPGMIHIGNMDYFNDLVNSISVQRTIILAEGVTDTDKLLSSNFSYKRIANRLGLTSQENLQFNAVLIDSKEISSNTTISDNACHILRADVDVNSFNPKTIGFLNMIGENILNSESIDEGLRKYLSWFEKNHSPDFEQIIMNDILFSRNKEVINHMNAAIEHYDIIIIPWGAIHMPEIEQAVYNRGFSLKETHQRISIDFKTVFSAILTNP